MMRKSIEVNRNQKKKFFGLVFLLNFLRNCLWLLFCCCYCLIARIKIFLCFNHLFRVKEVILLNKMFPLRNRNGGVWENNIQLDVWTSWSRYHLPGHRNWHRVGSQVCGTSGLFNIVVLHRQQPTFLKYLPLHNPG